MFILLSGVGAEKPLSPSLCPAGPDFGSGQCQMCVGFFSGVQSLIESFECIVVLALSAAHANNTGLMFINLVCKIAATLARECYVVSRTIDFLPQEMVCISDLGQLSKVVIINSSLPCKKAAFFQSPTERYVKWSSFPCFLRSSTLHSHRREVGY